MILAKTEILLLVQWLQANNKPEYILSLVNTYSKKDEKHIGLASKKEYIQNKLIESLALLTLVEMGLPLDIDLKQKLSIYIIRHLILSGWEIEQFKK